MKFFLSYSENGRQVFFVEDGKCTDLLRGAKVFTHHSAVFSKYTMDPHQVVEVSRLPAETILSDPGIERMLFREGDNAIRAQLGYLDGEDAPSIPEVALVMSFKEGKINSHSLLVGGRPVSIEVPLNKLEGLCKGLDTSQTVSLGLDIASISFAQGRKATEWKRIEEMFKDCLSGSDKFSDSFIYARWRILEAPLPADGAQGLLSLHLEVLPLDEALADKKSVEVLQKHKSSSNIAISLVSIPLVWRKPDSRKKLFTTPCLTKADSKSVISDGIVRLSMAMVRDTLRCGKSSEGVSGHKATVSSPQVLGPWKRSPREVFMPESDTLDVIGKGKYKYFIYFILKRFGPANTNNFEGGIRYGVTDLTPCLHQNYRVFARGDKIIFGSRTLGVEKYNGLHVVPPRTEHLLGEGAPEIYHSVIGRAIAASLAAQTKPKYKTALRMLASCQESLGRKMKLPLSNQDVLCFIAFMANRDVLDSTISKYLSAIRYAMISVGHECDNLRTAVVNQVLKGIRNLKRDPKLLAQKKTRRAMTIPHLKLLGHALKESNLSTYMKSAVWAGSMLAFWGSSRIGELMCPYVSSFDPKSSLLLSDVKISKEGMKVWIRSPKCCTPMGDIIEIFPVSIVALDPVAAVMFYLEQRKKRHGQDPNLPFFLEESGKCLTKQKFNTLLHKLLDDFLTDNRDSLTGHSFRSGLATLMEVAGFSKEDIQAWGRWSSEAFVRYCKERRPRKEIFRRLHKFCV